MLSIYIFTFNALQENTYVLAAENGECWIIDPGCYDRSEQAELFDFIAEKKLTPVKVINTHCHVDHVLGNAAVKRKYNIPLLIHPLEEHYLRAVTSYAPNYGFVAYEPAEADGFLKVEEPMDLGGHRIRWLFVPGHSAGHVALYCAEQNFCVAGDVLFRQSIGRTDLPGGNHEQLLQSIRTQLFTLPPQTVVYPGHGPETTIEFEKRYNPFFS
ncbi:MAG: Metallo-beta-lactamase family protein [Chitinophagaceae bacterium]|nr:Metallo-beta-lactamase family protein [Chitinophagaceae bacterium]